MERGQRLVDCPEHAFLTEDEVARYLRFSVNTLTRLVDRGDFPTPLENSDRGRVWSWKDVLWYALMMEIRPRLGEKFRAQESPQRGQESPNGKRTRNDD